MWIGVRFPAAPPVSRRAERFFFRTFQNSLQKHFPYMSLSRHEGRDNCIRTNLNSQADFRSTLLICYVCCCKFISNLHSPSAFRARLLDKVPIIIPSAVAQWCQPCLNAEVSEHNGSNHTLFSLFSSHSFLSSSITHTEMMLEKESSSNKQVPTMKSFDCRTKVPTLKVLTVAQRCQT